MTFEDYNCKIRNTPYTAIVMLTLCSCEPKKRPFSICKISTFLRNNVTQNVSFEQYNNNNKIHIKFNPIFLC